jgi:hypothetical protein
VAVLVGAGKDDEEQTMATESAECTFVVKEGRNGRPFIQVEPTIAGVDIAFAFRGGTRMDTAHDLARQMRRLIVSISLTVAPGPDASYIVDGKQ